MRQGLLWLSERQGIFNFVRRNGMARKFASRFVAGETIETGVQAAKELEMMPTTEGALDLKLRLQMQSELKALQHRVGTTFIYVTHDQGEALTMSDRIAVMYNGRIEQIASSEEIYARPKTRFVASFIGEANFLHGRVAASGADGVVVRVDGLQVWGSAASAFPPGTDVTVSVRPEHVKLGTAAGDGPNRWEGRVQDVVFMGPVVRARVALAGGLALVAEVQNDAAGGLAPGATVAAGWSSQHTVVLAR